VIAGPQGKSNSPPALNMHCYLLRELCNFEEVLDKWSTEMKQLIEDAIALKINLPLRATHKRLLPLCKYSKGLQNC